jgi:AraC family transcriptional activator of pobA
MRNIPHYRLYGDKGGNEWFSAFNFEWIPQRSAGYQWEIQPHVHESFIQILYLTAGSVEISLNNAQWQLEAPGLIVVPARNAHGFYFSSDVNGPVITVDQQFLESLAGVAMPALLPVIRKPLVMPVEPSARHADALLPLLLAIEREWQTPAEGQAAAGMSLVVALLVQIARLSEQFQGQAADSTGNSRKNMQIEKFRALVDRHFKEHLPLIGYADKLGISAGQVSRICRDMLGMSALDVINARLMHEAERDLIYTSVPIKQLAGFLGFEDEAYFGRFFRKHAGMTPKEFRLKALARLVQARQPSANRN